jgi:hypothetical protein
MGRECSTHGEEEEEEEEEEDCLEGIGGEATRKQTTWKT